MCLVSRAGVYAEQPYGDYVYGRSALRGFEIVRFCYWPAGRSGWWVGHGLDDDLRDAATRCRKHGWTAVRENADCVLRRLMSVILHEH